MNISDLLDKIVERPPYYVGSESVTRTKAFIDGYKFAIYNMGAKLEDPLYTGFQDWIAKRFRITTEHDWGSIISFMGVSDSASFTLLKKLWSEYKAEMSQSPK